MSVKPSKIIEVLPVGTKLRIGFGEVEAILTAVCVRGEGKVTYEASWWNGRERKVEWFEEIEIEVANGASELVKIGFRVA